MTVDESSSSMWSREQDKAFENALATYSEEDADRWEKIAADVPGKSLEEIKYHYEILVDDVGRIESGSVPLPCYMTSSDGSFSYASEEGNGKKNSHFSHVSTGKGSKSDQERRKGIAWTEEEHRLFLLGLEKYGKGDWRSISRHFVVTRTPTQVASHAQKYYIRLTSINKDRRRSSIHDITSVNSGDVSVPQGPITGQTNSGGGSAAGVSTGKSNKPPPAAVPVPVPAPPQPHPQAICIGQPLVSAVGTPANVPPSPAPPPAAVHMAYGVRTPIPGPVVPGTPMNMGHMTSYPMPHTSAHR